MPARRSEHRDDLVAVAQLLGLPISFVGLWSLFVLLGQTRLPVAVVLGVGALLAVAGAASVAGSWARLGGPRAAQALRRWVRDGPEPEGVSLPIRQRFLRRHERATVGFGRLYFVVAGFWVLFAGLDVLRDQLSEAALQGVVAAVWIALGVTTLRFARRWGDRVEQLATETHAALDGSPAN